MDIKTLDQLLRGPMKFAYGSEIKEEAEYQSALEYIQDFILLEIKKGFRAGYEMAGDQVHAYYCNLWSSLQTPPSDKKQLLSHDSEGAYLFWKKGKHGY